jgi:hypothetical protein
MLNAHQFGRLGTAHVDSAKPILLSIIRIMGVLSGLAIIGGIGAIVWNAYSPTEMNLFDARVTTGHVGVAFTPLGLITMAFVLRSVLKRTKEIAELPESKSAENAIPNFTLQATLVPRAAERKPLG